MKRALLGAILTFFVLPQPSFGQSGAPLVDFKATGYEYSFVKSNDRSIGQFWKIGTVNGVTGWSLASLANANGVGAFGTLNNTANPPCPLNESTYVSTFWPSSRDLIVRRKISLPTGARNVVIQLALDNGAKVYFNGELVQGAEYVTSNGCATLNDQALRFAIPDTKVRQGDNFLAIHGVWLSSKNFLDVKVTGDLTVQVTTTIEGVGTVTPASPTLLLPGQSYTAMYKAGAGYRLAGITINGVAQTITPTPDRVSPTEYTLPAITVNGNLNIVATFVLKQYLITAAGTENGTLTPASLLVNHGATSGAFTAEAVDGYHVATATADPPPATLFSSAQPTSSPATTDALVIPNVLNDMTIRATFEQNYYSLTYTAGANGTVKMVPPIPAPYNGSNYYLTGSVVTLRAVANTGFYFTGWTGVDAALQLTNPLPVTMNADKNITASFALLPDPVTITVGNLEDSGPGSLRQAILDANTAAGEANIVFRSGLGGTITLRSPLPALADVISIDGGTGPDGQPLITVLQPDAGFTGNPDLPDGFQLSGVFLGFGYTPEGSTIKNLQITGFPGAGICIGGDNNTIQGCIITGNDGDGICIVNGSNNLIGGKLPGEANRIFRNEGNGVSIKKSAAATAYPYGNAVLGNSIYEHAKLGIDLGGAGVSLNRYPALPAAGSPRPAPDRVNYAQAYPDLRFASVAGLDPVAAPSVISGKLYGWPGGTFRVEIYMDSLGSTSGNGEGKRLIAAKAVTDTDAAPDNDDGVMSFEIVSTVPLLGGELISATATDDMNNTSEFSPTIIAGTITRVYGATDLAGAESGRFVVNTTFAGDPLYWPDGKGTYTISPSVPGTLKPAMESAFGAWKGVSGLPNGVKLQFAAGQAAATETKWGGNPDGVNHVVFLSSNWEATTYSSEYAIAVTRVRYNALTGAITDADIAFNSENFQFANYPLPSGQTPDTNMFDAQSVATHEIGHYLGLGDQYNLGDPYASLFHGSVPCDQDVTMYGIVQNTDTFQRQIWGDDIKGLSFIYNYVPRAAIDLMFVFDASQSFADPTTINGFAPSRDAAIELVDKMREGDRIAFMKLTGGSKVTFQPITGSSRETIKQNIASLLPDATDTRPLGTGLTYAADSFSDDSDIRRAIILYSAGNETAAPSALSQGVIDALRAKEIRTFTMGFAQSPQGANLSSILADTTGGAYYEAVDTTISTVTNQIWTNLAGYQLVGDSTLPSEAISYQGNLAISYQGIKNNLAISWQSATKNTAISYQGRIDAATTSIYPAISYQGKGSSLAKAAASTDPKFVLALVPPDVDPTTIDWGYWENLGKDPPFVITPFNVASYYPHVKYVEGPTYAFYEILPSYPRKKDGIWFLVPVGDMASPPAEPIPVHVALSAATDVVMDVTLDQSNYAIGEPVALRVRLQEGGQVQAQHTLGGGPINGAIVYAEVTVPGQSSPSTYPLTFSGNGVYTLVFTNTNAGGTYSFGIHADGVTPQGQPFSRHLDQSIYVMPAYSSAVLFAKDSISLADNAWVKSGDILVNRDAALSDPGVEFRTGSGVRTTAGYDIKADRMQIGASSTIASDVYYNQIVGETWVTGERISSLSLPVDAFPPFEATAAGVATASGVTVPNNGNVTLAPNTYGDVSIEPRGTLTLGPGTYNFKSLRMKSSSKLYFKGATRVRILSGIHADNSSVIAPLRNSGTQATDAVFFVQSTNAESPSPYAVNISPKSSVAGTIYAPNGTIFISQETDATGAFLAKNISIGTSVQVSLASAFSVLNRPSAEAGAADLAETAAAEGVPETYELSQNYPNPFNPSTTISYALPLQGHVSLIVYDALGREVTRLVDNVQAEGYHTVQWSGVNAAGSQVSTGIYFYRFQAGDFSQIRKMVLVK